MNSYKADPDNDDAVDPWDMIADKSGSPEDAMFAEPELENPQAEAEQTGKLPSSAAMTNRKNKIIDKVAKSFGVERVKRHKYPKQD